MKRLPDTVDGLGNGLGAEVHYTNGESLSAMLFGDGLTPMPRARQAPDACLYCYFRYEDYQSERV